MAAENILGKLIIEGANRAGGIAGGAPSLGSGLAGGGGGGTGGSRSAEMETRGFQKTVKDAQLKAVNFAKEQPKWWTRTFKTLGIQMGLAGILKQSQVFTSTIGAFFQIFGAMVDVMLVPLVKPILMPLMRWFARQIPTMGRLSKAVFGFLGSTIMAIIRLGKKMVDWGKDTYNWLKDKGEGIWKGIKNLGSLTWWQEKILTPTWEKITSIPGQIVSGVKALFSWDTWSRIFSNLWNATLGGVKVGKGQFSFTFPTWHGGSTFEMENLKTPGHKDPTLVTVDDDGRILSYESTGGGNIESGFKTGLDKEGKVLEEKYGKNMEKTGKVLLGVWEWMKTNEGGTLAGYKTYKEQWMKNREPNEGISRLTDFGDMTTEAKDAGESAKNLFMELPMWLQAAVTAGGLSLTAGAIARVIGTVKSATGLGKDAAMAPGKMMWQIMRPLIQQLNPLARENFFNALARNKLNVPETFRTLATEWRQNVSNANIRPGSGRVPSTPSVPKGNPISLLDETVDWGSDVSRANRMFPPTGGGGATQYGDDLAELGQSRTSRITAALTKARQLLAQLTAWMVNQLKNLKNLLSPQAFAQAERHLATKADEIMLLLKSVPENWPGAAVSNIVGRLALLKSFLARAVPLVGAAVGAVMTAKNIRTILGTDLSWFTANENSAAAQETNAQIQQSLGLASGALSEGQVLWQEGGFQNKMKGLGAIVASGIKGEGAADEAMRGYMSHTKGGAILNQLLMGTATTGSGLLGAPGLTVGVQSGIAQELAMADVRGNSESIALYNQLLQATQGGSRGVGNELNLRIEIDGLDASLFNGLY